jgi:hypothetical protein
MSLVSRENHICRVAKRPPLDDFENLNQIGSCLIVMAVCCSLLGPLKNLKESINNRLLQTLRIELRTFCVLDRNHNR